mmetsp:Transcript_33752/g.62990  ORF Transcript_33752/g.62990 Transcript_33752/m.62990 type:complete len:260 (+) Transcript_33752:589-1368(+)
MVSLFALSYRKLGLLSSLITDEEVSDLLIVDFDDRTLQLYLCLRALPCHLKQLLKGALVDARVIRSALHGVCLSRAGLAIGKDTDVEAIQHGRDKVADALKDQGLCRVLFEDLVELPRLFQSQGFIANLHLIRRWKSDATRWLPLIQRPHSRVHADVPSQFLHQVVQLSSLVTLHPELFFPFLNSSVHHLLQSWHLARHRLLQGALNLSLHVRSNYAPQLCNLRSLRGQLGPNSANELRRDGRPLRCLRSRGLSLGLCQ